MTDDQTSSGLSEQQVRTIMEQRVTDWLADKHARELERVRLQALSHQLAWETRRGAE